MRDLLLLVGVSQKTKAFRGKVWRETVPTRARATDTLNAEPFRSQEVPADGGVCRSFRSAEHLRGEKFVVVLLQAASSNPMAKSHLRDLKKVRVNGRAIHISIIRPPPLQDWLNQMDAAPVGQRPS